MEEQLMDINLFIDRSHFKYDRQTMELFQAGHRENRLKLDSVTRNPDFYSFTYNKTTGELAASNFSVEIQPNDLIRVIIPQAVFVSGDAACTVYNEFSQRENWNFFLADQATMKRLGGRLPEIEIDYQSYIVDLKFNELRDAFNSQIRLRLTDFQPVEDGRYYQAYFNTETQMLVDPEKERGNLQDIQILQIPNEFGLDPVFLAQKAGLHDTAFLLQHPIQSKLKGELFGLTVFKAKKQTNKQIKPETKPRQRVSKRKPRR